MPWPGEQALEKMEGLKVALVLIDIFLAGKMDGIELSQEVAACHQVPFPYITAYSNKEVLERAKGTHPSGYIVKPFRESRLKVAVELALAKE